MATYRVHLLIVSDQASDNICPLLDNRIKPDEIILATPPVPELEDYQRWLIEACRPLDIKCTPLQLPPQWQVDALRASYEKLVSTRLADHQQLSLNCSCGQDAYGILAHEVFFNYDQPVFYIHNDWVRWLHSPNAQSDFELADRIRIPMLLQAYGLKVEKLERNGIAASLRTLASHWRDKADTYSKAIGILNNYAMQARDTLRCKLKEIHSKGHTPFSQILDQLQANELAWQEGNTLVFRDEASRFFCNGGWLEELLFSELYNLTSELPKLQDVARSVEVTWQESHWKRTVRNELDVVVLYDNRLLVIECKTKRFEQGDARDLVYKIGSLIKYIGGLETRGMIASFHNFPAIHRERAQLMDVHVCDRTRLRHMRQDLKNTLAGITHQPS